MTLSIVLQFVLLAVYIGIFVYQFNTIKLLTQKFDALERFQKIFDLEKVEKYVDMLDKNANLDKEIFKKELVSEEAKKYFTKHAQNIDPLVVNRLLESLYFICDFLEEAEDQATVETVLLLLPENREMLERILANRSSKTPSTSDNDQDDQSRNPE